VGYAEKIYELIDRALGLCRQIIDECECASGCPSCVPPLPPGVNDEELEGLLVESDAAVQCTRSLLTMLLDGRIELPEVRLVSERREAAVDIPPEDEEAIKLNQRLGRAADILQRKRRREH
jgi:ATP-dependent helicase YprA (DUF1998 family)